MGQKFRNSGQNATHSAIQTRKKRASARPPLDCTKPWIPMPLVDFCSLKVSDIDSERMIIRVEQGKGRRDRYTSMGMP